MITIQNSGSNLERELFKSSTRATTILHVPFTSDLSTSTSTAGRWHGDSWQWSEQRLKNFNVMSIVRVRECSCSRFHVVDKIFVEFAANSQWDLK